MIGKCNHRAQAQTMACYECMQADEISKLQTAVSALKKYGEHSPSCDYGRMNMYRIPRKCFCGLKDVLKELGAQD